MTSNWPAQRIELDYTVCDIHLSLGAPVEDTKRARAFILFLIDPDSRCIVDLRVSFGNSEKDEGEP